MGDNSLWLQPVWELGDDWLHAMRPCLPRFTMAAQKSWKNTGMLAGVIDCGRCDRNGAAEEDWCWDLNLGLAAMLGLFGSVQLWRNLGLCSFSVCPFLPRVLGSRRDFACKKRLKGFLLVGHEKVPHGFGLTGGRGSNTAYGARTERLPESRGCLNYWLLLFLRCSTPDWAEGEGRTVHLWVF